MCESYGGELLLLLFLFPLKTGRSMRVLCEVFSDDTSCFHLSKQIDLNWVLFSLVVVRVDESP